MIMFHVNLQGCIFSWGYLLYVLVFRGVKLLFSCCFLAQEWVLLLQSQTSPPNKFTMTKFKSRYVKFAFMTQIPTSPSPFKRSEYLLIIRGKRKHTSHTNPTYGRWLKSCTTKDDDYPIIYRVSTIPGGAGFQPSTVSPNLGMW